jgi:hypothetical protein
MLSYSVPGHVLDWWMGGTGDSRRPARRSIGAAAKADFLAGLRAGMARDAAAAQAGFSSQAFYGARKGDAVFKLGLRNGAGSFREKVRVPISPSSLRVRVFARGKPRGCLGGKGLSRSPLPIPC